MVKPHWSDPLTEEEERLAGPAPLLLDATSMEYLTSVEGLLSNRRHPRTRIGEREPLSQTTRVFIWHRDGKKCRACGIGGPRGSFEIDHIIPWSAGGSDDIENLRLLCRDCNQERSNFVGPLDHQSSKPVVVECVSCCVGQLPEIEDRRSVWCATCRQASVGEV